MATDDQQQRGTPPVPDNASAPATAAPSTIRTVPDLVQVQVDQWGHRGEYVRGQIINLSDLDPAHYDHEHAIRVGAVRRLTEAEARPESRPSTSPLNDAGEIDEDHRRAMQYGAGITPDLPRTVTTAAGPPEPAEFAKPTIPFTGDNQAAARPVVVVDTAVEAETEGTRAARIVATPAGSVFESADERTTREAGTTRSRRRSAESGNDEG